MLKAEAKLYLLLDMMGDLRRSGALQWKIQRNRTEDIKDHVFDLVVMTRMLKDYLPSYVDTGKMIDYALVHDLPEIITGDITGFEGITREQKRIVNTLAIEYLTEKYGSVMNLGFLINGFEEKVDLEAKILSMLDKVNSSIPFMKYDNESTVDMDNPEIIECLRNNEDVVKMKNKGMSLGEIFYVWHLRSVNFTDDELFKYNISREDANRITDTIKLFMASVHDEIKYINELVTDFPKEATTYRHFNDNN